MAQQRTTGCLSPASPRRGAPAARARAEGVAQNVRQRQNKDNWRTCNAAARPAAERKTQWPAREVVKHVLCNQPGTVELATRIARPYGFRQGHSPRTGAVPARTRTAGLSLAGVRSGERAALASRRVPMASRLVAWSMRERSDWRQFWPLRIHAISVSAVSGGLLALGGDAAEVRDRQRATAGSP